jgi:hypothetical protein
MGDIKNPDCMMASAALDALADGSFSAPARQASVCDATSTIILQAAADAKQSAKN